ncbi:DUF7534 family protein [Halonotius terrestris]|uniref:DUF7534 family protein n=1 Tax=Halonotius terrestris TaxID=2487750 RepID=UPI00163CBFC0|nr:hypothetical protein [Halonotius terrestris]
MNESPRLQFVAVQSLLIILGFAIAAQVSPPDVYSQIVSTVVILVVTLPVSYWIAYRRD